MKEADDAPAGTETLAGTVTAVLLLARATLMPPEGAAALRDTVHEVLPVPVNVVVPHVRPLRVGKAEPAAFNCSATLLDELLALAVTVAV